MLRTLARLEGRTPEEVALDHIARGIPWRSRPHWVRTRRRWPHLARAMFDGPADLAAHAGEGLFGESEGQ